LCFHHMLNFWTGKMTGFFSRKWPCFQSRKNSVNCMDWSWYNYFIDKIISVILSEFEKFIFLAKNWELWLFCFAYWKNKRNFILKIRLFDVHHFFFHLLDAAARCSFSSYERNFNSTRPVHFYARFSERVCLG